MSATCRRLVTSVLACLLIAVAGCYDDEPVAPDRPGTLIGPSLLLDPGGCQPVSHELIIEICRLPTLGGAEGDGTGHANGVNDDDWIVGSSSTADNGRNATLWKGVNGDRIDLKATAEGLRESDVYISNAAHVVGWRVTIVSFSPLELDYDVLRWQDGVVTNLNSHSSLDVIGPTGVNDFGFVTANGRIGTAWKATKYTTFWMPPLGGPAFFRGINNQEIVVGSFPGYNNLQRATRWDADNFWRVLDIATDNYESEALAVSNAIPAHIVGYRQLGGERHAFKTVGSTREITVLPGLGGNQSQANDVNDSGDVVGESRLPSGLKRAVLWTRDGQRVDLGGLGGPDDESYAVAINNTGTIVGDSRVNGEYYPTLWRVAIEAPPPGPTDSDGDGIEDAIDTDPNNPSDDFSDGTTSGTLVDWDGLSLTVTDDASLGVRFAADPLPAGTARIDVCGGAGVIFLPSGARTVATCGSVDVTVEEGSIGLEFTADNGVVASVASLAAGNSLYFDPVAGTLTAPAGNEDVTVVMNGREFTVSGGGTLVLDAEPPAIDLVVDPTEVWPPNHRMVKVAEGITATDNVGIDVFTVTVTSDEPTNGLGDGDTEPDWQVEENDGAYDVWVRAERAGKGDGRTYTITAVAVDPAGNTSMEVGTVTVPHSKVGKKK